MSDEKKIYIREVKIMTSHTIATAPYENIKVGAELIFGVPVGCTDAELQTYVKEAQGRLKAIIVETYRSQKRPKQTSEQVQQVQQAKEQ